MKSRLFGIFSCMSRLLNVLTGGSADMTFSARCHKDGLWAEKYVDGLFYLLTRGREKNHCLTWYVEDVSRARITVAEYELRVDETLDYSGIV